jgi:hypothetical protein
MSGNRPNFHWTYQLDDISTSINLINEAASRVEETKLRGNWLTLKLMRLLVWMLKRTRYKLAKNNKAKTSRNT